MPSESLPSQPLQPKPRHLLVPFDGTDISLAAVDLASTLAKALVANLTIMHVVQDRSLTGSSLDEADDGLRPGRIEALARPVLAKAFARLAELETGVRAGEFIAVGEPADEILQAIDDLNVDLLVLWRTKHSALGELFFGSTSDDLLDRAPCPVVVLK